MHLVFRWWCGWRFFLSWIRGGSVCFLGNLFIVRLSWSLSRGSSYAFYTGGGKQCAGSSPEYGSSWSLEAMANEEYHTIRSIIPRWTISLPWTLRRLYLRAKSPFPSDYQTKYWIIFNRVQLCKKPIYLRDKNLDSSSLFSNFLRQQYFTSPQHAAKRAIHFLEAAVAHKQRPTLFVAVPFREAADAILDLWTLGGWKSNWETMIFFSIAPIFHIPSLSFIAEDPILWFRYLWDYP